MSPTQAPAVYHPCVTPATSYITAQNTRSESPDWRLTYPRPKQLTATIVNTTVTMTPSEITEIIASLAGTYTLLNTTAWNLTTGAYLPSNFGLHPVGLLTYTREGYMSANMAATEPPYRPQTVRWPPRDADSAADWALVGQHAMSYAGRYSLNESVPATAQRGQLLHGPMMVASVPSMVGAVQARNYTVIEREDGVYLKVSPSGVDVNSEIWWRRVAKG